MTTSNISELRKKYYAGDASLAEEKLLQELLLAPDAPEEWKQEGEIIARMSTPPQVVPPTGFERRLLKRLEQEPDWQAPRSRTASLPLFKHLGLATAIAASLGYSNATHFSRQFHQFTGMSPKQYRQND